MKAISVEALSKTFSGGTVAVDEIGFSLDKGEIGVTVFLCTHQLRYAQEICTTYGLMDKGHLFATGNITELRAMVSRNRRVRVKASCLPKGMVYKEVGDHIYDVDVASEHDIQQRAVFLIFPILALVIGQFTGILLINSWLLLGLGAVLVVLDVLLMRGAAGNFTYEKLLK